MLDCHHLLLPQSVSPKTAKEVNCVAYLAILNDPVPWLLFHGPGAFPGSSIDLRRHKMTIDKCPNCDSHNIQTETVRKAAQSDMNVGEWRIGCGYTLFAVVVLTGAVSLLVRALWLDESLVAPAMRIALAAFCFAAFVLIVTIYLSRWSPMYRHTCQTCGLSWLTEIDSSSAAAELDHKSTDRVLG